MSRTESKIRQAVQARFLALLPNKASIEGSFRKAVIDPVAAELNIKPKACKAVYHSFLRKMRAEQPELVAGIGREEGKRGGRPRKSVVATATASADANETQSATSVPAEQPLSNATDAELVAEGEMRAVYRLTNKVKNTYQDFDTAEEAETARKAAKLSRAKLDWEMVPVQVTETEAQA